MSHKGFFFTTNRWNFKGRVFLESGHVNEANVIDV